MDVLCNRLIHLHPVIFRVWPKRGYPAHNRHQRSDWDLKQPLEPTGELDLEPYAKKPQYSEIVPPKSYTGYEKDAYEKKVFADVVRQLPTASDKLRAVNPYERNWNRAERRWHRVWHDPLVKPRLAWRVPACPEVYNALPFYQYITRTAVCKESMPEVLDNVAVDPVKVELFDALLKERLAVSFPDGINPKKEAVGFRDKKLGEMLASLFESATAILASDYPHVHTSQLDHNSSHEAFWIRCGFRFLYDYDKDIDKGDNAEEVYPFYRLTGDNIQKRGEMLFCYRENIPVQLRFEQPLPQFAPRECDISKVVALGDVSPIFVPLPQHVYNPEILGLKADEDPLEMKPGVLLPDPQQFVSLMAVPVSGINDAMTKWGARASDSDEYYEAFISAGLTACFGTLVAQAHYLGFNQYNDLTFPLTTTAIVTDGVTWQRFAFQLNSLNFMNDWEEKEGLVNVLWSSEAIEIHNGDWASGGGFADWNPKVASNLLKLFALAPSVRPDIASYRPYFSTDEECGIDDLDSLCVQPPGSPLRQIRVKQTEREIFMAPSEKRERGLIK